MTPEISYVTGTCDRYKSLRRLIASVRTNTPFPWELLVSDFSFMTEKIEEENVIHIKEPVRLGMSRAYNAMFARARGKWIVWLNDDAEIVGDTPRISRDFMAAHPEIGLGALYYREGPGTCMRVNDYRECVYANFGIIAREVGNRIGWFGTDVPMYGCDNVIAFEVLRHGLGVVGIPDTKIVHHIEDCTDARKLRDGAEGGSFRKHACATLERKYDPIISMLKVTHDKFKHLGGPMTCQA